MCCKNFRWFYAKEGFLRVSEDSEEFAQKSSILQGHFAHAFCTCILVDFA